MNGSHIHKTTYDDDGLRRIVYWNHMQQGKDGFRVLRAPAPVVAPERRRADDAEPAPVGTVLRRPHAQAR